MFLYPTEPLLKILLLPDMFLPSSLLAKPSDTPSVTLIAPEELL